MMFLIVCSFFAGILLALAVQFLILRRWFYSLPNFSPTWKPQTEAFTLPKELNEALKNEAMKKQKESFLSFNVVLQFLFQELKDTKRIRRWVMKRMKMEFEELLRSTTGKLLEHITVRDFNLGKTFPIFKNVAVDTAVVNDDNTLEEVSLVLDLTYNGRFQLAVDVDMVFGKSAYLSVVLSKLQGTARLQFTRQPYTHWSFAFMEDPQIQFEVESHFEGRPIAQLTSVIINQIRKSIRKKHTLPNYKIRYRPFFVTPVTETAPQTVYYHGSKLTIGRLEVFVISCSRLVSILPDSRVYCTLALDSIQWMELMSFRRKLWTAHEVEVVKTTGQNIGLSFGEVFLADKYEEMVVVTSVVPGSPAAKANIQRNDLLVAINGVKLTNSRQAVRLMKNSIEKISLRVERPIEGFSGSVPKPVNTARNDDAAANVKGMQKTSINADTSTEPTISVNQNGGLDALDAAILSLATETERSSLDETSLKNFNVKSDVQISQSSSSVLSAANSAPSSPPLAKKGLTQMLTTGSGLFQRKKTKSEAGSGLVETARLSKDITDPDIQTNDVQTLPKKEKRPPSLEAKVAAAVDLSSRSAPPREVNQLNRKPETQLVTGADSVDAASHESSHRYSTLVSGLSNASKAGNRTKMRTTHFTKACPNPAFNEKFEFDVEEKHNYLNVCIWNRQPEKLDKQGRVAKPEKDVLLGHISIPLMDVVLECLSTLQGDVTNFYYLTPSDSKVEIGRSQHANLATHSGFNERLCHGELSLRFQYTVESISKKDRDAIVKEENESTVRQVNFSKDSDSEDFSNSCNSAPPVSRMSVGHSFTSVHFQMATYCNFCSKKIWLKTAFQCKLCGTVCHKKCIEKCQVQMKCAKPTEQNPKKLENERKEISLDAEDSLRRLEVQQSEETEEVDQVERKRHNSAPDEAVLESSVPNHSEQLSGANSLSRTRSSTSLGGIAIETLVASNSKALEDAENLSRMFHRAQNSPNSDELVVTQAKKIGKELFANLDLESRKEKLDSTIVRLQGEIDSESEHKADLTNRERAATDKKLKKTLQDKIEKSEGKLHSLTVLMLQYCAGLQHCLDQEEQERQRQEEMEQAERDSFEQTQVKVKEQSTVEEPSGLAKETEADEEGTTWGGILTDADITFVPYQLSEERHDQPFQRQEREILETNAEDLVGEGDTSEQSSDTDVPDVISELEQLVKVDYVQSLLKDVEMSSSISVRQLKDNGTDSVIEEEAEAVGDSSRSKELFTMNSLGSVSLGSDAGLLETMIETDAGPLSKELLINDKFSSLVEDETSSVCSQSEPLSSQLSNVEAVETSAISETASN